MTTTDDLLHKYYSNSFRSMQNAPKYRKIARTIKPHPTKAGLKNFEPHFYQCARAVMGKLF